jgi:hypothetical protein
MTTESDKPAEKAAPTPGTPEHDAAMVALATERMGLEQPTIADKPTKPAGVPDKFWDAEKGVVRVDDLAKSYTELEKARSAAPVFKADTPAKVPTVDEAKAFLVTKGVSAEDIAKLDEDGVKAKYAELNKPAAPKSSGIDMAALNAEFAANGDLTAETRQKLADDGYPKEIVDGYISGQKALAEKYDQAAFAIAGGEASFKAMADWASQNFTEADAKAYNEAVTSRDVAKMNLAVQGLKSRYEAAEGLKPNLLKGDGSANSAQGFTSREEMVKAMSDPRYKKDPAYRKTVETRVGLATFF